MRKAIPLVLISLSFILAFLIYPFMPPTIASHWGISGKVNGYLSKFWGLYLVPAISTFLYLIFRILPSTDPYRKNFKEFENHFDSFMIVVFSFLIYTYLLTIFWNLGYKFNIIQLLSPAFAVLFYSVGSLTANAKMNWFVGIRTPWTMSHKVVWQKTHVLGSKLFKLTALITLFGVLVPQYAFYLMIIPILTTLVVVFIYSYSVFLGQA